MAKSVPNVDILTDTFNTWVLRTNEVIDVISSEAITANSTQGVTGTTASPRNALLNGTFTANTLAGNTLSIGASFVANSTTVLVGDSLRLIANNSSGAAGQLLTTDGSRVYWSTAVGSGTVTQITSGNGVFIADGLNANTITSTGTIRIRAGDGIVVDSRGISVNTAFLAGGLTNALTLQGRTWEAPAAIGNTLNFAATANTGTFTTVTAGLTAGYRLQGDSVFRINNTEFRTQGIVDSTSIRVRGNPTPTIEITNNNGTAWANFSFNDTGRATYSNTFVASNFTFANGREVGFKTIPQLDAGDDPFTLNPTTSSGAHYYKTTLNAFSITIPDDAGSPCPIGTAITFINDAASGDITLLQGAGVTLQLGGTLTQGARTIGPGGVVTALKVQTNKWIVSGSGVT
jgi:hypothetical protein